MVPIAGESRMLFASAVIDCVCILILATLERFLLNGNTLRLSKKSQLTKLKRQSPHKHTPPEQQEWYSKRVRFTSGICSMLRRRRFDSFRTGKDHGNLLQKNICDVHWVNTPQSWWYEDHRHAPTSSTLLSSCNLTGVSHTFRMLDVTSDWADWLHRYTTTSSAPHAPISTIASH